MVGARDPNTKTDGQGFARLRQAGVDVELLDGDLVWLDSAPSDFQACLGKRVWVTGSMDDPPFMIGVID